MTVLDVLNSPWAILPDKYAQIRDIYVRHLQGERVDLKALEAELGRPLENKRPENYDIVNGVAVIPVLGVVAQRMNLFSAISGGTSTQALAKDFADAMARPEVNSVLLVIDSPGGEVNGTQEFTNDVFAARGVKPIVALCEGVMASAAYWIGSAADEIYISSETVQVGSIGVVAAHTDTSRAEQMRGVKVTEVAAGKYKRILSGHEPLTAEGRDILQADVDYIYSVFVNDVARNRARSVDKVLAEMAEGRLFLGRQAISAGLADGIATTRELIGTLVERRQSKALSNRSAVAAPKGLTAMEIQNATPGAVVLTAADVEAAKRLGFDTGFKAGAEAERQRIQAVEGVVLPGHEALVAELKFDGVTSGPEAAARIIAAERAKLGRMAANLRTDAPNPAPHDASDRSSVGNGRGAAAGDPADIEAASKNEWATKPELRREFTSEAAYLAFKKAEASGQIRILAKRA
jgi:signal peptide peptidase SppA